MARSPQILRRSAALILAATLAGCASDAPSGESNAHPPDAPAESEESDSADAGEGCFIQLFDSDDFDEGDDHFTLTQPGRYADLDDLPGADQSWTDEADSVKVGPSARVVIYSETDFAGGSLELDPGSEHPDLESEPSSLELTCE